MPAGERERVPKPGWWQKEDMMLSDFLEELRRFQEARYEYEDIEYTHDVFAERVWVGEAGMVEVIEEGVATLGFLSIGMTAPSYQLIDERLRLVQKQKPH